MKPQPAMITLTFTICYDRPNHNSTVFSKEAIQHAFASSNSHMPILMQGSTNRDEYMNTRVIGYTDPTYYFDWDDENKECNVTFTGHVFDIDADIVVNEMQDDKITDFEIRAISILQ